MSAEDQTTYHATFAHEGEWVTVRVEGITQVARLHPAGADPFAAATRLVTAHREQTGATGDFVVEMEPA